MVPIHWHPPPISSSALGQLPSLGITLAKNTVIISLRICSNWHMMENAYIIFIPVLGSKPSHRRNSARQTQVAKASLLLKPMVPHVNVLYGNGIQRASHICTDYNATFLTPGTKGLISLSNYSPIFLLCNVGSGLLIFCSPPNSSFPKCWICNFSLFLPVFIPFSWNTNSNKDPNYDPNSLSSEEVPSNQILKKNIFNELFTVSSKRYVFK